MYTQLQVIHTAYETIWRYTSALGNPLKLSDWDHMPQWQKNIVMNVGGNIYNADLKAPAAHNQWYAQKLDEGWTYAPEFDPVEKESPLIIPYDELPVHAKMLEIFFATVINGIRDKVQVKDKPSMFEVTTVADLVQRAYDAFQIAADPTYWDKMWEKTHKDINAARDFADACAKDAMYERLNISRNPI